MLSEGLYQTKLAGDPTEYLNQSFLDAYRTATNRDALRFRDLMADMERRRTSPNGVFGMNVKYDQMAAAFRELPNAVTDYLRTCDLVIWLQRRDRVQQAVSAAKSRQRRVFNIYRDQAYDPRALATRADAHPADVATMLDRITEIDRNWAQTFEKIGVRPVRIFYEDVSAHYHAVLRRVLAALGVEAEAADLPEPPTVKLRTEEDARLRRAFFAHLGVSAFTGDIPGVNETITVSPAARGDRSSR